MSFGEYLHEKAEESRHNETLAFLIFLAGSVFFIGGLLTTLNLAQQPEWFGIIPYHAEASAGSVLGLTLLVSGICLVMFGFIAGLHYSADRRWYMIELHKAHSAEEALNGKKFRKKNAKTKRNNSRL